jgi:hypothetical protein
MSNGIKSVVTSFVFVLLFASLMIYSIIQLEDIEKGTRNIKCYDRYSNEIKDLVCKETYRLDEYKELLFGTMVLVSTLCFFMSAIITMASILVRVTE